MMNLYIKARITEAEAETLIKASEIIIDANGATRLWTDKQIAMRKAFEKAVIRAHIIGASAKPKQIIDADQDQRDQLTTRLSLRREK